MKKKHKKHHKSDRSDGSAPEESKPLKLVLKVGSASSTPSGEVLEPVPEHHHSEKKHKHKKKKKKKSSEKDRDHDRDRDHNRDRDRNKDRDRDRERDHDHDRDRHDKRDKHDKHDKHERQKHHHERSKKEKRKHEIESQEEAEESEEPAEPPAKKSVYHEEDEYSASARNLRERAQNEGKKSVLQQCLNYIHKILQRKDVNGFFAFPVTDSIAPGYSSIISDPMDFSTMKYKIDCNKYSNVNEYKKDFKLMLENCMVYNRPETIYNKEAKRLLASGLKAMTKERLLNMKKNLPFMVSITNEELGVDQEEVIDVTAADVDDPAAALRKSSAIKTPISQPQTPKTTAYKYEADPDDLTPDEILAQAQAAAEVAADALTLRKPNSKIGFLRRREDGSTSLNILNPENDGIVGEKERIVNLGSLTGKLQNGTGNISGFKEDKRNKATTVTYLNYGPYSSYAPTYDSSFTNLTKEDSDLLLSTYGDETGFQYAKSLKDFVSGADSYAIKMVDNLLDILTGGEHNKALKTLKHRRATEEQAKTEQVQGLAEQTSQTEIQDPCINLKQEAVDDQQVELMEDSTNLEQRPPPTSQNDGYSGLGGIDMSFLDSYDHGEPATEVDKKLSETSQLIQDLQKTQYERLSIRPTQHLANLPGPSDKEKQLAEKVTKELTELAKQVKPSDLAGTKTIRSAMGINLMGSPADVSTAVVAPQQCSSGDNNEIDLEALLEQSHDLEMTDISPVPMDTTVSAEEPSSTTS